jgi:Protein of unknown function (DUF3431)
LFPPHNQYPSMLNHNAALFLLEARLTASCHATVPMSKNSSSIRMPLRSRRLCRIVMGLASLVIIWILLRVILQFLHPSSADESASPHSKTLVVGSLEKDGASWLYDHLPDWKVERFIVDNPSAQLKVPQNKRSRGDGICNVRCSRLQVVLD